MQEFVLSPGDLLFIPAGYLHAVHTETPLSAHLSFMWQRGKDDLPVEV
jgi:quercetin dioxygenase-like cupin family protein